MFKLLLASIILLQTSIYTLHFTSSDGSEIDLSAFKGKKLLIVNIATSSPMASQLADLQSLQDQYKDSLVVIAIPSNSFGNESKSDAEIKAFCESNYHTSFLIAQRAEVKGAGIHPLYNWITNQSENGMMQGVILQDFQKYLVDGEGRLIGVFAASVKPTSQTIQDAITAQ